MPRAVSASRTPINVRLIFVVQFGQQLGEGKVNAGLRQIQTHAATGKKLPTPLMKGPSAFV